MPEEIHLKCIYCRKDFNYEWQGRKFTSTTGVCDNKNCIKQYKQESDNENIHNIRGNESSN